jgi:hypothetical protein
MNKSKKGGKEDPGILNNQNTEPDDYVGIATVVLWTGPETII